MGECHVCKTSAVVPRLDLGEHPVSSHFTASVADNSPVYDINLGICPACGVIQLMQPLPYKALISPYDWFSYREPEGHLDHLVGEISTLSQISPASRVLGVSIKDQSTIDRFSALHFSGTAMLDPRSDLGIKEANAGVECVQHYLTDEWARGWVAQNGACQVVIGRHIVEHAENVGGFLSALAALLDDGGYLVLEVPDCLANLQRQDIAMVWEEHTVYFTPDSFRDILTNIGFEEVLFVQYPLTFEDCLVVVGRKPPAHRQATSQAVARRPDHDDAFKAFVDGFTCWRDRYRAYLQTRVDQGEKIALYGAGHLSCAFVNYYGFADLISFVVEDTPEKQGLFLPGSNLPIVPSAHLVTEGVGLCLLSLSPDSEDKVIANNAAFVSAGGRFLSIFAASGRSMRAEMPEVR